MTLTQITKVKGPGIHTLANIVSNTISLGGIATASNFKTGTSNLHNVGLEIAGINVLGADTPIGTGATIYNSGAAVFTGVVTATSFVGSGAALTGVASTEFVHAQTLAVVGVSTLGSSSANNSTFINASVAGNAEGNTLNIGHGSGNNAGLTVQSATGYIGSLFFTDTDTGKEGGIQYYHTLNELRLYAGETQKMALNSDGTTINNGSLFVADKIIHTGDTDTAIRFPAANNISFETTGSEALRIDSNQRVMIGSNASGGWKFRVQVPANASYQSAVNFTNNVNADLQFEIKNSESRFGPSTNTPLVFKTNNTEKLRITSTGNIEIGGNDAAQSILLYEGQNSPSNGDSCGAINWGSRTDKTVTASIRAAAFDNTNGTDGYLTFHTSVDTANGDSQYHLSEKLRITSDGKMGLGTNGNPVGGDFVVENTTGLAGVALSRVFNGNVASSAVNTPSFAFTMSDTATNDQVVASISPQALAGTGNAFKGHIRFFTANDNGTTTEKLRIDSNGRLTLSNSEGIKLSAVTSSLYALDGSLSFYSTSNGVYLNGAGANGWLRLNASGVTNSRTCIDLYGQSHGQADVILVKTAGSERLKIEADGTIDVTGNVAVGGNLYFDSDSDTTISNANTANWLRFKTGGQTVMDITDTHHVQIHDDHRLRFGASNDIQIWHNSSNNRSYFFSPQNNVYHEFAVGNSWTVQTTAADKRIECPANGTETGVRLFHNGSQKLETKSFGVQIEVTPRVDLVGSGNNVELKFIGNSSSHRGSVYADNGNTIGFLKAGTGAWAARWHSDGKQTAHGDIVPNADMSQTLGNSSYQWSSIYGQNLISRTGYPLQFYAANTYAGRITTYGEWRLQTGTNSDNSISTDFVHGIGGTALDSVTSNLARLVMQERTGHWISFKNGSGTHYGSIYLSGSNVVYGGQSSDYRIKENVISVTDGITKLKKLKPIYFNYTTDSGFTGDDLSETHIGFIAHEFQEVCPHGASGVKDDLDIVGNCTDDSNTITQFRVEEHQKKDGETWTETSREPKYQQVDFSKAVPVLTAALQEAIAKIETLETKVAALESS